MSVGYATLYGDMCGGYAVLKDVYKMTVFALSRWRNQARPDGLLGPAGRVIPERVITKPPSAELKPDQTDQDTLPPYDVLDGILECLVEHEMPVADIVARGHDEATVRAVWRMLDRAEYKRRQAPPGVKITRRAFGRDRRYPITNGFQDKGPAPVQDPGERRGRRAHGDLTAEGDRRRRGPAAQESATPRAVFTNRSRPCRSFFTTRSPAARRSSRRWTRRMCACMSADPPSMTSRISAMRGR